MADLSTSPHALSLTFPRVIRIAKVSPPFRHQKTAFRSKPGGYHLPRQSLRAPPQRRLVPRPQDIGDQQRIGRRLHRGVVGDAMVGDGAAERAGRQDKRQEKCR